ncbi:hypothetical protein UPYG_G00110690 [Umbra pygmaea]|uniref:Peptidase S1 domain-containing protein n=1 Tax=Umbra pygmaea TaxID=75934 RepID=A0ABD0X6L8_UMBPY
MGPWGMLFVVLLVHDVAGFFVPKAQSSIAGGEEAPRGSWPWMAYVKSITEGGNSFACGGSLITKDWVLTAAHCVDPEEDVILEQSRVYLGVHSIKELDDPDVVVRIMSNVVIHQNYNYLSSGFVNDIALVKLSQSVSLTKLVKPVKVASSNDQELSPGTKCWVTGWGLTEQGDPRDGILQQLMVPILRNNECLKVYPKISPEMICAGFWNGGKNTCMGDSGGPLVCASADGFAQVGITGFRSRCNMENRPGIYTRVESYEDFIQETIKSGSEAPA